MKNKPLKIIGGWGEYEVDRLVAIVTRGLANPTKNEFGMDLECPRFIFNYKDEPKRLLEIPYYDVESSFFAWLGNFDKKIKGFVDDKNEPLKIEQEVQNYKKKVSRNMFLRLTRAYWKDYLENKWCVLDKVFADTIYYYNN
jgi:hypothetical protein